MLAAVAVVAGGIGVLGTPASATATAPPSDSDLTMASLNLSLFMIQNLDAATSGTIPAPCPFLTQEAMNAQLTARGLTPTNDGYEVDSFFDDDIDAAKVSCGVDVVDVFNNPDPTAPHGVTISGFTLGSDLTFADVLEPIAGSSVIVPDVPGIGGEIGGSCVDDGGSGLCYLFWHRNELVISVALAGPMADVTQDGSVQLLTEIVPPTVASLVAYDGLGSTDSTTTVTPATTLVPLTTVASSTTVLPATTVVPATTVYVKPQPGPSDVTTVPAATVATPATTGEIAGLVPAATAALKEYLAINPIGTAGTPDGGVPCPVIDANGLAGTMTASGLQPNMAGFEVSVLERTDWVAGLAYVNCGVGPAGALIGADPTQPPHYASIEVYDITGAFTWDEIVASLNGAASTIDPITSGDIVSSCTSEIDGSIFCGGLWHLDNLVVRVSLVGPVDSVTGPGVEGLTLALAPTAVTNLANGTYIAG
ncbi:hypothetical protein BH24ACT5_BH24ACT5_08150 [soil metagenome]